MQWDLWNCGKGYIQTFYRVFDVGRKANSFIIACKKKLIEENRSAVYTSQFLWYMLMGLFD